MTRPAHEDPFDEIADASPVSGTPEAEPLALFGITDAPTRGASADPDADPRVCFLHTADWQLGMTRHFLAGEAQHTYSSARQDAVVRIGELASTTGAEFVIVCGDVFDDPRVSSRVIRRALDALGAYPVPVYLLPGNHDPHDATSVYRSREFIEARPDNVIVLTEPGVVRVRDGVSLVAAPWTTKRPVTDLVSEQIAGLARSDDIRIVVGHGGVDMLSPNTDPSILASASIDAAVVDGMVDYVALGDRHSLTAVGDSGRVWYPGAPEVTAFDHVESEPGHVLQVTLTRGAQSDVEVVPHRVGRWAFRTIRDEIDGSADIDRLRSVLDGVADKSRTVVQLALSGTIGVADEVMLSALLEEFADKFAALTIWERHHDLTVVSDPSDVDALALQGYAAAAAVELADRANTADDTDDARAARAALGLLYRLTGASR